MGYDTYKLCGLALVVSLSVYLLRNIKRELEVPLALIGSLGLLASAFTICNPIIEYVSALFSQSETSFNPADALLKVIGIAVLTKIAADVCREMGTPGVASSLEIIAKFEIIILSLPLVSGILDTVRALFAEAGL